ncbi:MAG TPA: ParB/RepB/Spo0J family partition protein [Planctomycetota bacterium]|jgi:ParB-like chromosome segregation protein Spo0J|nr:ParB N-terminal domain-containing protein [Planctomycetota bacterium]OQC21585.1 MAG: hypothetical protein BWX69_00794 [Planctomycetes bacterium ADurb.Bin069]HNR98549.1 ParB/RepB/Spo0J family partition protein [Planctomycetota bacterium]HNU26901.1 ParB/RepB/Spo0J family partition protein [Planctomycetota bacterium]HOE28773.1 ParB/RepB/Spo0J family partition protein [Planctomycetota bacterium]
MSSANDRPPVEFLPAGALRADTEAERRYIYTRTGPSERLRRSIAARGIMTPLAVAPDGLLLCGARRLRAAADLGLAEVPVVRTADAVEAFLAGVWENAAHREFAPLELAGLFRRLQLVAGLGPDEIAAVYLPACGLPSSPVLLAKYLALADLPEEIAALPLRPSHLFLAAEHGGRDAAALAAVFAALQPSAGEARILRELLADAAVRERRSIAQAAALPEIRAVLAADTPPRLKVSALRSLLRRRALPRLSAWEDAAREAAARGGLAGPVEVKLPPDLEGDEIELRARVRDEAGFARAAEALGSARARAAIKRILAILAGEEA